MNIKKTVIGGAAATALGIAALAGTGTAFASSAPTSNTHQGSNVQQGDQNAPDTAASAEKASTEKASTETGISDGPGGHADAAGSNVDHQFGGNE